jgi:uncharacterized paraquat-inducible protein A
MNPATRLGEAQKQIRIALEELDLEEDDRAQLAIARQVVAKTAERLDQETQARTWTCPECHAVNLPSQTTCQRCETHIPEDTRT